MGLKFYSQNFLEPTINSSAQQTDKECYKNLECKDLRLSFIALIMPIFVGRLSTEKKHQYLRLSLRHERLPKISINARIFQRFRNRNHYLLLCAARERNNVICYGML